MNPNFNFYPSSILLQTFSYVQEPKNYSKKVDTLIKKYRLNIKANNIPLIDQFDRKLNISAQYVIHGPLIKWRFTLLPRG